jgi:hypothetical protein
VACSDGAVLRNLEAAYQIASAKYVSLTAAIADQGDDVQSYSIDGQSITNHDVQTKLTMLLEQMERLKRLIQMEAGPYEIHSYGF